MNINMRSFISGAGSRALPEIIMLSRALILRVLLLFLKGNISGGIKFFYFSTDDFKFA